MNDTSLTVDDSAPRAVLAAERDSLTQTQMRNVHFQVAPDVVLRIRSLRGEMVSRREDSVVVFDDKHSFTVRIAAAEIALASEHLNNLVANHVFGYRGSPLRDLRVSIEGGMIRQRGKLRKIVSIPFDMTSVPEITESGMIRIRPRTMRIFGMNGLRLMRIFGLRLSSLMDVSGARGVSIEGNDLLLDPLVILPPPRISGRVVSIRIEGNELVQTFRTSRSASLAPLKPSGEVPPNYMYFQGGTLRFGKLYMVHADMLIADGDPTDPFRFSVDDYNRQLVAGYSKNEADMGLRVTMPDLNDTGG